MATAEPEAVAGTGRGSGSGCPLSDRASEIPDLVDRYEAGERVIDLAEAFDLPPSDVTQQLLDARVPLRPERPQQPLKELPGVAERYESGMPLSELAIVYGVAPSTVRRRLHDAGITLRPRGGGVRKTDGRTAAGPLDLGERREHSR